MDTYNLHYRLPVFFMYLEKESAERHVSRSNPEHTFLILIGTVIPRASALLPYSEQMHPNISQRQPMLPEPTQRV